MSSRPLRTEPVRRLILDHFAGLHSAHMVTEHKRCRCWLTVGDAPWCRAEYWTGSPPAVTAAQLADPAATAAPAAQAGPALAGGAPAGKLEAGVAIEIGIDAAGDIRIVADPPLASPADTAAAAPAPHPAAEPARATAIERPAETSADPGGASHADGVVPNAGGGGAISPAAADAGGLWLDPATGDGGAPLLAAAHATAALQLGVPRPPCILVVHERSGCRHAGGRRRRWWAMLAACMARHGQAGHPATFTACCRPDPGALQRALQRAGTLAGAGGTAVLHAGIAPAEDSAGRAAALPGAEPGHAAGAATAKRKLS